MGESYAAAGVSIESGEEAVRRIAPLARSTFGAEVLSGIGSFGSVMAVPARYRQPLLVASTDGVGTKLQVAVATGRYETVGIDLVAMCVDDVAVQGADPLFFLDYIAVAQVEPAMVEALVAGMADGCRQAGCALVGGEVAEHGEGHALDLAGFAVGVVERDSLITGRAVAAGDALVALPSPGLRSNGYSLARRVLIGADDARLQRPAWGGASHTLADELLRPSIVYAPAMAALRRVVPVHAFAHITGGGLPGNVPRVLPDGCLAVIDRSAWPEPQIFDEIRRQGDVADEEMARVFNLGLGMVAVVPQEAVAAAQDALAGFTGSYVVGRVVSRPGPPAVEFSQL
ncbi:MAG TPA: phosphoribosylformylglycinamidine cyclo-ligase [Acidimicrobiales bacterium]|nr:phosphoribosylformylglycinamidine cyclo-ligase [Acidimicrobiales bacterium]